MRLEEFRERAITVPFAEKGRDWGGWDCWGLVCVAYRDVFGVELPHHTGEYDSTRRLRELRSLIERRKRDEWTRTEGPRAGDVVLSRLFGHFCHVGLMLNGREVIHVEESCQVVIEDTTRAPWTGEGYTQVEGFYRHESRI